MFEKTGLERSLRAFLLSKNIQIKFLFTFFCQKYLDKKQHGPYKRFFQKFGTFRFFGIQARTPRRNFQKKIRHQKEPKMAQNAKHFFHRQICTTKKTRFYKTFAKAFFRGFWGPFKKKRGCQKNRKNPKLELEVGWRVQREKKVPPEQKTGGGSWRKIASFSLAIT